MNQQIESLEQAIEAKERIEQFLCFVYTGRQIKTHDQRILRMMSLSERDLETYRHVSSIIYQARDHLARINNKIQNDPGRLKASWIDYLSTLTSDTELVREIVDGFEEFPEFQCDSTPNPSSFHTIRNSEPMQTTRIFIASFKGEILLTVNLAFRNTLDGIFRWEIETIQETIGDATRLYLGIVVNSIDQYWMKFIDLISRDLCDNNPSVILNL